MARKETGRALTPEEQTKTIIVGFEDGPLDDLVLRSDSDDLEEAEKALHLYLVHSDGGKIGSQYQVRSDDNVEETELVYEVVDRSEDEATIRVHFEYMGEE
jgi:hypothetical protein